jgi:flagellum-specific peptidoglycan hydrolase FlgJ
MLMGGRYKVLRRHGKDYRKWAQGLRELGYATDKNYDKKLINIIERFNLHQFDDL